MQREGPSDILTVIVNEENMEKNNILKQSAARYSHMRVDSILSPTHPCTMTIPKCAIMKERFSLEAEQESK